MIHLIVAVLFAGGLAIATFVLVRAWSGGTVRVFGRRVHRPGLWAVSLLCLSTGGLIRLARLQGLLPTGWETPSRFADLILTSAFVVLGAVHAASRAGRPTKS